MEKLESVDKGCLATSGVRLVR